MVAGLSDDPAFRFFQFAVPLAFRTSLSKGRDAIEDGELLATGVSTVAESDPQPCQPVPHTNSAVAYSVGGRVYRVNSRRGQLFRGALGTTVLGNLRLESQWIDRRFQADDDMVFTATGRIRICCHSISQDNGCTSHKASDGIHGPST